MIDVIAGLGLLEAVAERPDALQAVADFRTVYAAITAARTGGLDVAGMVKSGTLRAEVGALARTAALADTLLADKTRGPQLVAFVESLVTPS